MRRIHSSEPILHAVGVHAASGRTRACVMDSMGHIVGLSRGPDCITGRWRPRRQMRVLEDVARMALVDAGLDGPAASACWALADPAWIPPISVSVARRRRQPIALQNQVREDILALLRSGLVRPWGIAVWCGQSFQALAIAPNGREITWRELGDRFPEGAGEETRARAASGAPPCRPVGPVGRTHHAVCDAGCQASSGPCARRTGHFLGDVVLQLMEHLDLRDLDLDVVVGSVSSDCPVGSLLESAAERLRLSDRRASFVIPELPPVVGAAFQALRMLGIATEGDVRKRALATFGVDSANRRTCTAL